MGKSSNRAIPQVLTVSPFQRPYSPGRSRSARRSGRARAPPPRSAGRRTPDAPVPAARKSTCDPNVDLLVVAGPPYSYAACAGRQSALLSTRDGHRERVVPLSSCTGALSINHGSLDFVVEGSTNSPAMVSLRREMEPVPPGRGLLGNAPVLAARRAPPARAGRVSMAISAVREARGSDQGAARQAS